MSKSFKSFKIKVDASDVLANTLVAKHVKEKLGGYEVGSLPLEFLRMRGSSNDVSYLMFSHMPSRGYLMRWADNRQFERSNYHEFNLYELLQYQGDEVEVKAKCPQKPQFKLVEEFKVKVKFDLSRSIFDSATMRAVRDSDTYLSQAVYPSYKKAQDEAYKYLIDNVEGIPWSFTIKRHYRSEKV